MVHLPQLQVVEPRAIQERWETVEELERITTADPGSGRRPHLLSRTTNIALFAAGPLRIVRVGESNRSEEAWWRYGKHLRKRRFAEKMRTQGIDPGSVHLVAPVEHRTVDPHEPGAA